LFFSERRLQEQRSQPSRSVLCSSPSEDGFCSSETKQVRRMAQRKKFPLSARILQKLRSHPKTALGSSLGEDGGFRDFFAHY
jgi:hypothetical protein